MVDDQITFRVRWLNHVIDVHGITPSESVDFNHVEDHERVDWQHDVNDLFEYIEQES